MRAPRAAAAGLALTLALAGCGLGGGKTPTGVSLLVTRAFGAQSVIQTSAPKIVGQDTVMRLLERNATVGTRYGGGFVESIDGHSGGTSGGQPVDWFYYVNGVLAQKGAAAQVLHAGDHVWWDLHDWSAAAKIPAVVGSFPEPFLDGYNGKRYPTRIECVRAPASTCTSVAGELASFGLPVAEGLFLGSEYNLSLRVVVGPYGAITSDPAADKLAQPPSVSGVFARFIDSGHKLELFNQAGQVVRTLGPGAGLIAAVRYNDQPPDWYVTGTDAAGVKAAALAFTTGTLDGHFAVAVANDIALPLPLTTPGR
jgi:hypothetical protein